MEDRRIFAISQGNKSPHHCVRAVPFRVTLKCFLHTRNLKSGPGPACFRLAGTVRLYHHPGPGLVTVTTDSETESASVNLNGRHVRHMPFKFQASALASRHSPCIPPSHAPAAKTVAAETCISTAHVKPLPLRLNRAADSVRVR